MWLQDQQWYQQIRSLQKAVSLHNLSANCFELHSSVENYGKSVKNYIRLSIALQIRLTYLNCIKCLAPSHHSLAVAWGSFCQPLLRVKSLLEDILSSSWKSRKESWHQRDFATYFSGTFWVVFSLLYYSWRGLHERNKEC